jgi:tetratricopeptide (TPR) repeat protein
MNYLTKFSQLILYPSIIFNFGNLVIPANAHLHSNYYLLVQSPKSRQDLLTEIISENDTLKRIETLNRLIQTHPNFADAYYQRGLTFSELKKYRAAFDDFTQAIKIKMYDEIEISNPINLSDEEKLKASDAYYNRAITLLKFGNKQGAVKDLTRAINFFKNDTDNSKFLYKTKFLIKAYEVRGDLYTALSNTQNAIEDYNLVIDLVQKRPRKRGYSSDRSSKQDAQFRLANTYYKRGNISYKIDRNKAIEDLQKALAIFAKLSDKTNEQKVRGLTA